MPLITQRRQNLSRHLLPSLSDPGLWSKVEVNWQEKGSHQLSVTNLQSTSLKRTLDTSQTEAKLVSDWFRFWSAKIWVWTSWGEHSGRCHSLTQPLSVWLVPLLKHIQCCQKVSGRSYVSLVWLGSPPHWIWNETITSTARRVGGERRPPPRPVVHSSMVGKSTSTNLIDIMKYDIFSLIYLVELIATNSVSHQYEVWATTCVNFRRGLMIPMKADGDGEESPSFHYWSLLPSSGLLLMLTKLKNNAQISLVLPWPVLYPSTNCHEIWASSLSMILLKDKQANLNTNLLNY